MAKEEKILIVDDDLTLLEMYQERFRAEGYVVVGATDGKEALDKIAQEKPAVVILDVMMPKINGIDVLKKMRQNDETKDIPVIVLTALTQEIDKLKELLGPKDKYLIKSEDMPKDVVESLNEVLGKNKKE